jgi:2'-5' RNA ligase
MAMPAFDFGSMAARSFYLYESKLGAGGSRYTKIGEFPLGNPEEPNRAAKGYPK